MIVICHPIELVTGHLLFCTPSNSRFGSLMYEQFLERHGGRRWSYDCDRPQNATHSSSVTQHSNTASSAGGSTAAVRTATTIRSRAKIILRILVEYVPVASS